jgi:DNA-binding winged helix-turn-helix (wHTH) protein
MPANRSETDLPVVDFGEFRLDFDLRCLYRKSEKVKIGPIAFNTLEFLVQNRHRVISKDELLDHVWGGQRTKGTVEQAISQLRRVLQDDSSEPQFIETVPGHGYRFVAQVLTPGPGINKEDLVSPTAEVAPHSAANGISAAVPRNTTAWQWVFSHPRRMSWFWIAVILLTCGATAVVFSYLHRPSQIASATAIGNTLTAKGVSGNVLWTHRFESTLMDNSSSNEWLWRTQVVDLNGDGETEILMAVAFANPQGSEELLCFSSRGKLLWRYRPEIQMEFNMKDLNGPWVFHRILIVDDGKAKSVYAAVGHQVWWPAFLVKLGPDGSHETVFTSSGLIYSLQSVRTKSGMYVLAGGINNEYGMASVAVLAVNGAPAKSPQSNGSKYQCVQGCPGGRPYRYILLPRSELNMASDLPYNNASHMDIRPDGVTIKTEEMRAASQFFDFSAEFQPERVIYSSDYPEYHRRFEKEGRIAHSFNRCPEARNPAVVRIFDENGVSRLVSVPRTQ